MLERCSNLEEIVTIDAKSAGIGGSRLGLKEKDTVTVNDLLYGLLLRSGNDAASALAIYIGGSTEEFANLMNEKAKELRLTHTHFVTPHGLDDPNHYTTAHELASLTDYALKNDKFATIVKTRVAVIHINGKQKEIRNTNELLNGNVEGVYGVKTGFTNGAGRCLVTAVKRGNIDIIIVVLGADTKKDRGNDTMKLINYVFARYEIKDIKQMIDEEYDSWKQINQNRIIVYKGRTKLETMIDKPKITQMLTDKEIKIEISSMNYLEAPVNSGTLIGTITVKLDDQIIDQLSIKISQNIEKLNILDYMYLFARKICL